MRKSMIVCDVCEEPGKTVRLKLEGRTLQKDLCQEHEDEAFDGWKRAKKGRPPSN